MSDGLNGADQSHEIEIDIDPELSRDHSSILLETSRRLVRNPGFMIAAGFLLLVVLGAIFAPLVAPYDFAERVGGGSETPSAAAWLGTDDLGRDLLSRIIFASRVSMVVSGTVVGVATIIALPVGLLAGFRGGRFDSVVMRLVDAGLSFPPLVLALAIAGVIGIGTRSIVIALIAVITPGLIRLIRGQALTVREETFIDASRSIGTPTWTIVVRRMLPNVSSVIVVQTFFSLSVVLLAEAGLSYLGLGAAPPTPTWGNMLRRAYDTVLFSESWQLFVLALPIVLTVFAFNQVGDHIRDALGAGGRAVHRGGRRVDGKRIRGVRGLTMADAPASSSVERVAEDSVLAVEELSVEFVTEDGPSRVVDSFSFDVRAGEIVGLVGESGAGKTVTAMSVMRLVASPPGRIVEGRILFQGMNLLDLSRAEMRKIRGTRISMVSQDPMSNLDPAYTVGSQLIEAQQVHGVRRATARRQGIEMLEAVEIPEPGLRFNDYPHQLSGGMRQRVMIAMALINRPTLLIADEPTTALDVTIQAQILDLIRRLQSEFELSVLFVTHDLGVVADLCDRAIVMYAGQLVEEAPVHELFSNPRHPYTRGLLDAMPQASMSKEPLKTIPGEVPTRPGRIVGCRFRLRCAFAEDACGSTPIEVEYPRADVRVRCCRQAELSLRGSESS